jgi:transcriptional regulator with XRE-family HTH domain
MSTGNRIQAIREKRGWSRAQLAKKLGCTRMTVWRLETGKTNLSVEDLPGVARVLKAKVTELIA